jgi:hypothetical protein
MKEINPHKILASETILPDDYTIYADFVYIVGQKKESKMNYNTRLSPLHGKTVYDWKKLDNLDEVRRCELFDHPGVKLGEQLEL